MHWEFEASGQVCATTWGSNIGVEDKLQGRQTTTPNPKRFQNVLVCSGDDQRVSGQAGTYRSHLQSTKARIDGSRDGLPVRSYMQDAPSFTWQGHSTTHESSPSRLLHEVVIAKQTREACPLLLVPAPTLISVCVRFRVASSSTQVSSLCLVRT